MAVQSITSGWQLDLEPGYERHVNEDGDLVLHRGGRTIYASVFKTDDLDADDAIAQMLAERQGEPRETYDRAEPGLAGHAYLLPETDDETGRRYWGLNTWTASRGSVACVTFYFDPLDDLSWALRAWRSVRCDACGPTAYAN